MAPKIRESQKLPGVLILEPEVDKDDRGHHVMIWSKSQSKAIGLPEFVEENIITSFRGVLRGIHTDYECDKLMQVLHGRVYYVIVACKEEDPNFGAWDAFILSDENYRQIYKPRQYGAGLLALTDSAVFYYAQSTEYDPKRQKTFAWNDSRFQISWPLGLPILSQRDYVR